MASTVFTDYDATNPIVAAWLNDVNALTYTVFAGATDAASARVALGLGSLATQDASAVAITGGSITGTTVAGYATSGAATGSGLTMATNRLLGRSTAATGAIEEISLSGLTLAGGVLSVSASSMPRSYLAGFTMANNGSDATNDIDFSAGAARDSTNTSDITGTALTKRLDAAWAAGTNQGGLDTGAIANGTYHCYVIKKDSDGTGDYLFSTSATSPTMPSGYTYFRRIGSILRESAAIVPFSQNGDEFLRITPVVDVNVTNPGTSSVSRTLSIPTGIILISKTLSSFYSTVTGTSINVYMRPLVVTDSTPSGGGFGHASQIGGDLGRHIAVKAELFIRTNTSAQIGSRWSYSDGSCELIVTTLGWIDTRGRDA